MKPLAPKTILQNRYEIVRIIGKGGMGEVYLATDSRLGNEVALKRTTVGDDENLAAAFEREARTLASLRHPVLPKVSDHFIEDDEQYLVMDYISGEDLSQRLKSSAKAFPLNWVLFWSDQLLDALAYLHTNDPPIIHRDIKPQNLKLGGDKKIVLLDFGLSKNSQGSTRVTTSGSVVGYTPHYAPMEQVRGTGTNAKSDLYSLSATIYQLLTNAVPPDALTRADSLLSNLPDPLKPLASINSEISNELSNAIMRGMEIGQDRRFEDAREMQKALRRAYGSMKKSMTAETAVFNIEEPAEEAGSYLDSDAKTEIGMELPIPTHSGLKDGIQTETPSVRGAVVPEEPTPEQEQVVSTPEPEQPESTMEADQPVSTIEPEVAAPVEVQEHAPGENVFASEPEQEVFDEGVSQLTFEQGGNEKEIEAFDSGPSEPEPDISVVPDAAPAAVADNSIKGTSDAAAAGVVSKAAPAKKSSAGKYIAALLGLGAVLVLLLGTAAAGFYYYTQGGFEGWNQNSNEATPSPETTVEDALPPDSTPEPDNSNTTENTNLETNVNSGNLDSTPTPAPKGTVERSTPQSRPPVRNTPVPPKKKTPPPKPPVTPTPKKKKDPGVI